MRTHCCVTEDFWTKIIAIIVIEFQSVPGYCDKHNTAEQARYPPILMQTIIGAADTGTFQSVSGNSGATDTQGFHEFTNKAPTLCKVLIIIITRRRFAFASAFIH